MGQAKQRGSFEQRKLESIAAEEKRQEERRIEQLRRKKEQAEYDRQNPGMAKARHNKTMMFAAVMGTALGLINTEREKPLSRSSLKVGGKYNWKGQEKRLIYLGHNWSGNGYWHQFEKVEEPGVVWCEVLDEQLQHFEETTS